ncbi:MAG: 1-deoxy-D-xylulose-5-phosphate reductoisomerase, partial [Candidatus Melainabacteria bacterium]|nr:1-deoxy-D-xylulose-5-phosphate reductoisomerase [Candidatus Melainabacteria bacterium]
MKRISIIGSTGSIGTQALEIIRKRESEFDVVALSAGRKVEALIDQIKEFKPEYVSIISEEDQATIQELFPSIKILKDIEEIAQLDNIDIFLSAVVGIAGLKANLQALKHASRVAVANKETLVSAKHLVRQYCQEYKSELIPVDSEHVAIHQCLSDDNKEVKEILLTSSGGPFRTMNTEELERVSLKQALKHPKWNMGPKITIDSSTLMNKGLEVIEVNSLFDINYDQIQVVIHPQSIVHSAVTFVDGNTIAQMSMPDMMVPIQYAIDYPQRKEIKLKQDFNIFTEGRLDFELPDQKKFPALSLAYAAGRQGHSFPTALNSVNEAAVDLFLKEKIQYLDIAKIIEAELEQHQIIKEPCVNTILEIDQEIKQRQYL